MEDIHNQANDDLSKQPMTAMPIGARPLTPDEILPYMQWIRKEWRIVEYGGICKLESGYTFSSYEDSCRFVGLVSKMCREIGYAPDITFGKDYAFIALFSHSIGGIHKNDLIMATKIDELLSN